MNPVDYLRISPIDRGNFRCQYCMPDGTELDYVLLQNLLSTDELLTLIREVFIPVGFRRFRLTGGEPLLRSDVVEMVRRIAALPETQDLAMTTNGFLLTAKASALDNSGLRRVKIGLDSLDAESFDKMIGNREKSRWQQTWEGIQEAYRVGFNPLKFNVVVIPGVNDRAILDLAALSIDRSIVARPVYRVYAYRKLGFISNGRVDFFGRIASANSRCLWLN